MRREDAGVYAHSHHHSLFYLLVRTKNLAKLPLPASDGTTPAGRRDSDPALHRVVTHDETVKRVGLAAAARGRSPSAIKAGGIHGAAPRPPSLTVRTSQLAAGRQARSRCLLCNSAWLLPPPSTTSSSRSACYQPTTPAPLLIVTQKMYLHIARRMRAAKTCP
jgi:hypothetical protein